MFLIKNINVVVDTRAGRTPAHSSHVFDSLERTGDKRERNWKSRKEFRMGTGLGEQSRRDRRDKVCLVKKVERKRASGQELKVRRTMIVSCLRT